MPSQSGRYLPPGARPVLAKDFDLLIGPTLLVGGKSSALGRRTRTLLATALGCALSCHQREDAPPPAASEESPAGDFQGSSATMLGGEPRAHPIGELAVAPDYSMSMESDKECPLDSPFATKRGFVKVGIELSVEGTSAVEVPVNPFYATLSNSSGETFANTLAGCEPGLPPVRVTAGVKARGFVTFEIPREARKLELRYAPIIIGRGAEEVRFAVAR